MRIGTKLIINTVIIAVFSVLISSVLIGWIVYSCANDFLEEIAVDRFVSLRDSKSDQITNYYNLIEKQAINFSNDHTIVQAMKDFSYGFNNYYDSVNKIQYKSEIIKNYMMAFATEYSKLNGGAIVDISSSLKSGNNNALALRYNYMLSNPNNINNKDNYNYKNDGSEYSVTHKTFHNIIKDYKENFGYDDILLVEPEQGNIVYSVMKGLDYSTSLLDGPYAQTAIAEAFRQANSTIIKDSFTITDFNAYFPSYSNMVQFIASPIFDNADKKIGVLIFRITPEYINDIMTSNGKWEQSGWGRTGESYLLGHDSIMRTNSRFFLENPDKYVKDMKKLGVDENTIELIKAKHSTIGLQKINSIGAENVVARNTGVSFYKDYRRQPVIAAYKPLNIKGLDWGVICGIDEKEAFAAANLLAKQIIFYSLLIAIVISTITICIGFKLSRLISVPIEKLSNVIYILAKKQDLTKRIKVNVDDELGDIANALNVLFDNLQYVCQEAISSTKQMRTAAMKLYKASSIDEELEDNEQAAEEADNTLKELSNKLEDLSRQFKIFEEESDRTSDW